MMKCPLPSGAMATGILDWIAGLAVLLSAAPLAAQQKKPLEPWVAPSRASRKVNPEHADSNSVDVGKRLYERECLACHGAKGLGDGPKAADLERRPGNLADPAMWDQTDGALFWKISEGRAPMPTMKALLSDDERWHVVNYVRTLPPADSAPSIPKFATQEPARKAISQVARACEALCDGLAGKGDGVASAAAVQALAETVSALATVDVAAIPDDAKSIWAGDCKACQDAVAALQSAGQDVAKLRAALTGFSTTLIAAIEHHGHGEAGAIRVFVVTAPGGEALSWIQTDTKPRDPYGIGGDTLKLVPKRRLGSKRP
jgi:mono/diheme cytochrome c family protein